MRILAVTHSLGTNGAALALVQALIAHRQAGGSVDVLHPGNEALAALLRPHGIRFVNEAVLANYDLAIVNTLIDHERVIGIAPLLPVLFWVHEGTSSRDNGLNHAVGWIRAFRASARIVFYTPWQSEVVFKSFLEGVEPHRIMHVAGAGAIPVERQGRRSTAYNPRGIVALGSVYPRKRPADLVEAVQRLADPRVLCTLVGNTEHLALNGPAMSAALAAHPQRFKLAGEVVDEASKVQLLRDAAVFCSASMDETFGIAAVEGASLGLPLAITDLPCYRGMWQHGINALLAPVGAVDCLSWNLRALLNDAPLAARIAAAGQATAMRYTEERFQRAITEAMVQAVQDPGPATARAA